MTDDDITPDLPPVQPDDGPTRAGFVALIGEPNAGKSTLLNIVAGALTPDRGSVRIDDVEVTLPTAPGATAYRLLWDSTWPRPLDGSDPLPPGPVTVGATSLRVYAASDTT